VADLVTVQSGFFTVLAVGKELTDLSFFSIGVDVVAINAVENMTAAKNAMIFSWCYAFSIPYLHRQYIINEFENKRLGGIFYQYSL
jgi:hypothetical protein